MTITKKYTTTFTASALGYSMATKLAESYADEGWAVKIKQTSLHIVVEAEWGCTIDEGSDKDGADFTV